MTVSMEKEKNNLSSRLEKLFGLDLRSLALFRVWLALVIIVDLIIRTGDLSSLYSDAGVMPRTLLSEI